MFKRIDSKLININEIVSVEPCIKYSTISKISVIINFKNKTSIELFKELSRPKNRVEEIKLENKLKTLFNKVIKEIV
tara:strand:- start:1202 stop:1432 length:231 start_codon:yes stop_codon:yes gene_type:complete